MKVSITNHFNINQAQKLHFKSEIYPQNSREYPLDEIRISDSNIAYTEIGSCNRLKTVIFKKPLSPAKAILTIAHSSDKKISDALVYSLQPPYELEEMAIDLNSCDNLENIRIRKLVGMGAFATAFETTDGKILKVTAGNHFPNRRKPAFFDLPIIKHGKTGRTYYYLEEKVTQDNLTQEELRKFVRKIKDRGYTLRDYLVHYGDIEDESTIRIDQFGKTKDGKIYLIDPGCAIPPKKEFFNIKRLKNKIKNILKN